MFVLMVPVCMGVLVTMHPTPMAVLVPVMGVSAGLMAVLVLMLIFVVAAHAASPPFPLIT
jgi:hypothetical protein